VQPFATKVQPFATKVQPFATKVQPFATKVQPFGMEFNYISGNPALASEWERLFTHLTIAMKITSSFTDIDLFGLVGRL